MPEFIIPRDEKVLCELFGDFLFMKTEKFRGFRKERSDGKFRLNTADLRLLNKTGVVGRFFRRWFQTTWGVNTWSAFFEGETPRQELSHHYHDFADGGALLSVEMEQQEQNHSNILEADRFGIGTCGRNVGMTNRAGEWRIVPHLFLKKDFVDGGIFTTGMRNAKSKSLAPSFDFGFNKFAEFMIRAEKAAKSLKSYSPPENEEEKWWKLFWSQIGASLAFNIELELPPERLLKIALGLQDCMDNAVRHQGSGAGDFIEIDNLFGYLWQIITDNDKRLLSHAEMIDKNEDTMDLRMREPDYLYSTKVFYHLGHMFDEKILFPTGTYFGGAECVWTDQQNFLGAFQNTISLLKSNLAVIKGGTRLSREEKRQMDYMGIEKTALNIERTWFAPPTVFRLLPSVMRYF